MTPEQHRKRIAVSTLKMTPAGARIMGGMTFEEAYELVFKTPLIPRLEYLVKEYGEKPESTLVWEMEKYGWKTPFELLCALR